jgi:diaminopimelate decarboxylase
MISSPRPAPGADNHPMASDYHLIGRPPVIAARDGAACPLIRPETSNDLLARDIGL